ncbi:MAG: serine/threonine-protein kinase, partial [Myxococcota bacterium]
MTLIDELYKDHALQGRSLERYHIGRQLGRGAFGRVYYATDTSLDRPVALKFLLPADDGAYSEHYLSRFDTEAKLVSRLHGDTTVTLYDYGELDGVLYHALEYVDGVTLSEHLELHGPLRPLDIARFLEQLLEALREAHHHGIIHRDIKPSNIMVYTHLGTEERVKLMDFGISRDMNHEGTKDTHTGQLLGTVRYMSPEQTRSYDVVTPRSDLYALGMVAYEMLAGRNEFDDAFRSITRDERNASMRWVKWHTNPRSKAQPLTKLNPGVPATLSELVERLMEKEPSRRIRSANDVLEAIRRHLINPGSDAASEATTVVAPAAPKSPLATVTEQAAAATGAAAVPAGGETGVIPQKSKLPWILGGTLAVWVLAAVGFMVYTNFQAEQDRQDKIAQAESDLEDAYARLEAIEFQAANDSYSRLVEEVFQNESPWRDRAEAGQALSAAWVLATKNDFIAANEQLPRIEQRITEIDDSTPEAAEDVGRFLASLKRLRDDVEPRVDTINTLDAIEATILKRDM